MQARSRLRSKGSDTSDTNCDKYSLCENGTIPMVSVKTAQDIPKEKIMDVMECINQITVEAPVHIGDVLLSDVAATGVDIVATKNVEYK